MHMPSFVCLQILQDLWLPSLSSGFHPSFLEVLLVIQEGKFVQYGKELSPCFQTYIKKTEQMVFVAMSRNTDHLIIW